MRALVAILTASLLLSSGNINFALSAPAKTTESLVGGATDIVPPAIPLAVRSPYLSAWLASKEDEEDFDGSLAGRQPRFWPVAYPPGERDDSYVLPWNGLVRVEGTTYVWLGAGGDGRALAKTTRTHTKATSTDFDVSAGPARLRITFFTAISPDNLLRHSVPVSYVTVKVLSSPSPVDIYSDIGGEWATLDRQAQVQTRAHRSRSVTWHEVSRELPVPLAETYEYADWGKAVYALKGEDVTDASGPAEELWKYFEKHGTLEGFGRNHRPIQRPVSGLAKRVKSGKEAVFIIGHIRAPYIQAITPSGAVKERVGCWAAHLSSTADILHFAYADHDDAYRESGKVDDKIIADSTRVGGRKYAAITSLSTRQSFGALECTYATHKGKVDSKDPLFYLKEISSNGDMSTIDVIYPAFPAYAYMAPEILRLTLEPLLRYAESGLYPNKWPVHDIGRYPNATGHNDGKDEPMPVEEAGDMLIMMLSYAQVTGDISWPHKYRKILRQWTEFLFSEGLIPAEQLSTDDFAGTLANQTNLAAKAIVGIGAMGELERLWGDPVRGRVTTRVAQKYARKWIDLATSKDGKRTKLAYQDDRSWGTLYNIYGDRLLNLNLIHQDVYERQTAFYPTVSHKFGVPLDSRHTVSPIH